MTSASPPRRHERTRQVAIRVGVLAVSVPVLVGFSSPRAAAVGILPGANPRANVAPSPNFLASGACGGAPGAVRCANPCVTPKPAFPTFSDGPRCAAYLVLAIDHARAIEGVPALFLPSNFLALTVREQLFVLADLERTARGLPPYLGLAAALNAEAQHAARATADPGLAPGFAVGADRNGAPGMGGAWASAFSTLAADYLWMYDDGWGGSPAATFNGACGAPRDVACWAHRDELLGADPRFNPGVGLRCRKCEMGTGFALVDGRSSMVDLVERPRGRAPRVTFSWARDVVPYLPATGVVAARERLRRSVEARRDAVHGAWSTTIARSTRHACRVAGTRPRGRLVCGTKTFTTARHPAGARY